MQWMKPWLSKPAKSHEAWPHAHIESLEQRQFLSASITSGGSALHDLGASAPRMNLNTARRTAAKVDPASFVRRINNPFMPLIPGTRFIYKGTSDGKPARDVVTVTSRTRQIMGVTCTVVLDRGYVDGELAETTLDWYAQDRLGNVWYFGEDSKELRNGRVISTEGSWEAGVNGARPGIVMKAHPKRGDRYRQEFAEGVAEDRAAVLSLRGSAAVPFGTFNRMVQTKEFSPLEPDVVEQKFYARGIGFVKSVMVQGGEEVLELANIRY